MNELSLETLMPAHALLAEHEERQIETEAIFGAVQELNMRVQAGERGDELLLEAQTIVDSALGSSIFTAFDQLAALMDECHLHQHAEELREHIHEQDGSDPHDHEHKEKKTKGAPKLGHHPERHRPKRITWLGKWLGGLAVCGPPLNQLY